MKIDNQGPLLFFTHEALTRLAGKNVAYMAGDLEEEYFERRRRAPKRDADAWYAAQIMQSIAPLLVVRLEHSATLRAILAAISGYAAMVLCSLAAAQMWPLFTSQTSPAAWDTMRAVIQIVEVAAAGIVIGVLVRRGDSKRAMLTPVIIFAGIVIAPIFWMIAAPAAPSFSKIQVALLLTVAPVAFASACMGAAFVKLQR